jgi:polyketide synthase PksN
LEHIFSSVLGLSARELREADNFAELGISSVNAVELLEAVNSTFALSLPTSVVFEYPSMAALTSFVAGQLSDPTAAAAVAHDKHAEDKGQLSFNDKRAAVGEAQPAKMSSSRVETQGYAIVGMSCRFPQAEGLEQYWRNIIGGARFIEEIPAGRWGWRESYGDPRLAPGKTSIKWGAFITGEDRFDPLFFGVTPREAQVMEPELRLLLTYVWKAIEDAALLPESLAASRTGVFIATGPSDYPALLSATRGMSTPFKVVPSLIPNRISYALNLKGPSEYCETACSSALVAVHRAIQAMRGGECEQAIVGAVNLMLSPVGHSNLELMGALNPDGRADSFQEDAHGYVRGEGVGAIVIKPLADALAQGERIYAVVRGTGVGHGGYGASPSAPHLEGMKDVIKRAYREAGVAPETVGYIEAQGMASPLCDRTEVEAFAAAFAELAAGRAARADAGRCVIGTLKPSIGHCEYVSGMAALIKTVLALRHQVRPGVAGFGTRSSALGLDEERFVIGSNNLDWPSPTDAEGAARPRRASVNCFGIGGVNAHLVLEEYTAPPMSDDDAGAQPPFLIVLSAKNEERLEALVGEIVQYLEQGEPVPLAAIAYTLQTGRTALKKRLAMLVDTHAKLLEGLRAYLGQGSAAPPVRSFSNTRDADDAGRSDREVAQPAQWIAERRWESLAQHWARGGNVAWHELYAGARPQKVSLPGYPFEQTRYWPAGIGAAAGDVEIAPAAFAQAAPSAAAADVVKSAESLEEALVPIVAHALGVAPNALDGESPLAEWGLDSLSGLALLQTLRTWLGHDIGAQCFAEGRSVRELAQNIYAQVCGTNGHPSAPARSAEPSGASAYLSLLTEPPARMSPQLLELEGGARAEVFSGGRGRPLVLVPGIGMAGSVFREQCAFFAAHYRVIVYHYPGLGQSDALEAPSLDAVAAHLCETMGQVTSEPAALLGWSFGGMLAQLAALKCPERWRSLVLVNTFGSTRNVAPPSTEPDAGNPFFTLYEEDLEAVLSNGGDPSLVKERERILELLRRSRALSPINAIGYLDALSRFDASQDLSAIVQPTLVITGGKDRFNKLGHSQQLASLIPGAELLELAGAGHAPFITHPQEFNEAVLAFLRVADAHPIAVCS